MFLLLSVAEENIEIRVVLTQDGEYLGQIISLSTGEMIEQEVISLHIEDALQWHSDQLTRLDRGEIYESQHSLH